jgi:predicted Zn-dependent peptidase
MSYLYARTGSESGFERTSNETVRSGATWKWQAGRFFGFSQVKGPAQSLEASLALLRTATLDADLTVEEYERRAKSWMTFATTSTPSPLEAESFVLFGEGPYGFAGRGTTMVSLAQAKALHASLLQPAHSTLVVVGNVDPERLKAGVARSFAAWRSSGAVTRTEEPRPRRQGARLAFVPRLAKTQIIGSVFALGPGPTSEDATAFALLAQLLGGTPFSEFEETLREDLGAAYSFGSQVFFFRNASWLTTFASYQQDKAVDGVEATLSAIRNLRAGKVTDDEVDMVRERAAGGWREGMATVEGAAALYGSAVALDTNLDWIRDYPSRLRAVQKADIERAANSYLSDRALHVLFVGDLRWLRAENLGFGGPTELKLPE